MKNVLQRALALAAFIALTSAVSAAITLPAIIGSHMVLQRNQALPIWGWGNPGEEVTVSFAGKTVKTTCNQEGSWKVVLEALPASKDPRTMTITGSNTLEIKDILVGEVWICSGQSNMGMNVNSCWNADLEKATAKYPEIRLVTVGNIGSQEPQTTFDGGWERCSPDNVGGFSAVGYFFGRTVYQMIDVPVGLINNAWGGSACEAWVRRDLLADKELYAPLLERWETTEKTYDPEKEKSQYEEKLAQWEVQAKVARSGGKPVPNRPRTPKNPLIGQHRPANLYNSRLLPLVPFAIRGAIWYQGEANAGRAYQYRDLFPLMIQNWREVWGQGDFPFYWMQLADFTDETDKPVEANWAELREAQTMTLDKLPQTGQAVITDLGDAANIHPKRKQEAAFRLARLALANEYGIQIPSQSARFDSMKVENGKVDVHFTGVNDRLVTVDYRDLRGFALAGADQQWVWAEAKITGKDTVQVWSPEVPEPAAVRFAWANNPVANLYDTAGLPVTPFRSDDWPGITAETR